MEAHRNVLIAEDDAANRRLLEVTLTRWGYEVIAARDGQEAWEALQQQDAPRLAILDWMMPGLDGPEVCRRVREKSQAPYTYLLLLTSKDQKGDVIAGMEAGADDYLIKPFDPHELQVRLRAGHRILDLESALRDSLAEVRRADAALEQAHAREAEIGARIQQTLLLGQPPRALSGLRIAPLTVPSQYIDGDFYDFFEHNSRCLDVVVGDIMGKGVPAALLGAAIKSQFLRAHSQLVSALAPGALPEPEAIVSLVHHEVTRRFIGLDSFATLCYARFDRDRGRVTFVDCGHTKTIHFQPATRACALLEGESMPLGFSEREVYHQGSAAFAPGDVFLFYSDGVTEAQNQAGDLFGMDRLLALMREHAGQSPEALVEAVRRAIVAFSGRDTFADDLTCVAVKVETIGGEASEAGGENEAAPHATLTTESDLSYLPAIRAFVRTFCQSTLSPPLEETAIAQLELAATEAASNIVRHAYESLPGEPIENEPIEIEATGLPDRVRIQFRYGGKPFDPDQAAPPTFDGSREGGFGVYFIAQCVDEVRYFRDEPQGDGRGERGGRGGRNGIDLIRMRRAE